MAVGRGRKRWTTPARRLSDGGQIASSRSVRASSRCRSAPTASPIRRCAAQCCSPTSAGTSNPRCWRDGSGLVAEAYPDAALRMWLPDLWATGGQDSYKGNRESAHERRQSILRCSKRPAPGSRCHRRCETPAGRAMTVSTRLHAHSSPARSSTATRSGLRPASSTNSRYARDGSISLSHTRCQDCSEQGVFSSRHRVGRGKVAIPRRARCTSHMAALAGAPSRFRMSSGLTARAASRRRVIASRRF